MKNKILIALISLGLAFSVSSPVFADETAETAETAEGKMEEKAETKAEEKAEHKAEHKVEHKVGHKACKHAHKHGHKHKHHKDHKMCKDKKHKHGHKHHKHHKHHAAVKKEQVSMQEGNVVTGTPTGHGVHDSQEAQMADHGDNQ